MPFFTNIHLNFLSTKSRSLQNEFFDDIEVINDNRYVICFDRDSSTVNYNSIAIITDSLGNILHKRIFTNTSYFIWGRLSIIVPISNGDIFFTGTAKITQPFGSEVVHAIRTDSLLNSPVIGISIENENMPDDFYLSQNFPNPFNGTTIIKFTINKSSFVKMRVFDVLGREIENLVSEDLSPGTYTKIFDPKNLSSGIYFYRLSINGNIIKTQKMIYNK